MYVKNRNNMKFNDLIFKILKIYIYKRRLKNFCPKYFGEKSLFFSQTINTKFYPFSFEFSLHFHYKK